MALGGTIEIVLPSRHPRRWQVLVVDRLRAAGHAVTVSRADAPQPWSALMDGLLDADRRIFGRGHGDGLASIVPAPVRTESLGEIALRLNLTGIADSDHVPTLTLLFGGRPSPRRLLDILIGGGLPDLDLLLDGQPVAHAAPMVDNRASIARGLEDVLARVVTLTVAVAGRLLAGEPVAPMPSSPQSSIVAGGVPLPVAYALSVLPRITREVLRRARFRFAHWRVGYRLPAVGSSPATTGWSEVPDEGTRFLADPFPFEHQGRFYIFAEDYSHATRKAVISVVALDADGGCGKARTVLEEPWHLSYPQVFAHDGEIWMIPESSASQEVVLYRATSFPESWQRHAVLIAGREISDATLLERDGKFWLFATERDGHGSTSDTLVVFHAEALAGPWIPHAANPILIDRAAARPAGAFVTLDGRTFLPVQDGTRGYGSGLGMSEVHVLDETTVQMGAPQPMWSPRSSPEPQVHTFNRIAGLEVIDWTVPSPRWSSRKTVTTMLPEAKIAFPVTPITRPRGRDAPKTLGRSPKTHHIQPAE